MPSGNNDDFLTQVQLRAVALLEADEYFAGIPCISEVKQDIVQRVKAGNPVGVMCIVSLQDCSFAQGGGTRATDNLEIQVRVRELISINRGSSGSQENGLRVAQKVALLLDAQQASFSTDATPVYMGGHFTLTSILPAGADADGVQAWHVMFKVTGGGLCTFTRRGGAPAEGAP